jgi:hypothetical protein
VNVKLRIAKKCLCIIICLANVSCLFAQTGTSKEDYTAGLLDGKASANTSYQSKSWFAAGFGGGLLLGPIGAGAVVGFGQSGTVKPPEHFNADLLAKSLEYKQGFSDGYSKKAKSKRLAPSIVGGVIGTAVFAAIIVSLQDDHKIMSF